MKNKLFYLLVGAFIISLSSCGPKEVTDCDYKKVAEKALAKEANHIWKEYNGKIRYLAAHILNKNESLKLLELEDYHEDLDDYSKTRKAIESGYPVIELYYNFNGYSKRSYGGNTIGTYWHYEGNYTATAYRFWEDYKSCPCDENRGSSGLRWEYPYSTFFGLTPLFRNLLYNPAHYDTKWELTDIRNVYKDFTQEMIFEYERDTTSEYNNVDWSKWKTLNDSEFMKLITKKENSYYSIWLKEKTTKEVIPKEIEKEAKEVIIDKDDIYGEINDTDGYTNVREGKFSKSEILFQIYEDETFIIQNNEGDWWLIEYNGNQGYIHNSRVSIIN